MTLYVHDKGYKKRKSLVVKALAFLVVLALAAASGHLYHRYTALSRASESTINNPNVTLTGYINPYFMFKDTGKWAQSKADSTTNKIVYYRYQGGTIAEQLIVYIDKAPLAADAAANHVLPVKIVNGEGLEAGSISDDCSSSLPAGQRSVSQLKVAGVSMYCDPSKNAYSVVLGQTGSGYNLKMSKSNTPRNVVIVYKNYLVTPDPGTVVNITNSFRLI